MFLRNHDELDLGRLSQQEQRETVFKAFGPEPDMQLYDRGIRRRLAPMLDGDRRRIELAYSLMFTLPGTPVLRYGDELGMGDDLTLPERQCARTPMQWSDEPCAGFTKSSKPILPVVSSRVLLAMNMSMRRAAPRPELDAQLDRTHHPNAQGSAGSRLGRLRDRSRLVMYRFWRYAMTGETTRCSSFTTSRHLRAKSRSPSGSKRARRQLLVNLLSEDHSQADGEGSIACCWRPTGIGGIESGVWITC